jgi:hypothetical protein
MRRLQQLSANNDEAVAKPPPPPSKIRNVAVRRRADQLRRAVSRGRWRKAIVITNVLRSFSRWRTALSKPQMARTDDDLVFIARWLMTLNVKFFQALTNTALVSLSRYLTLTVVPEGETVVRQGEKGSTFYIIVRGACDVHVPRSGAGAGGGAKKLKSKQIDGVLSAAEILQAVSLCFLSCPMQNLLPLCHQGVLV